MLEIEVKYSVTDFCDMRRHLQTANARFLGERVEVDLYFNAPHRDFRQTDEAVRLRQVGEANCLTYKGPRIDRETKTRTEIEVPLAPGPMTWETARKWLEAIGFRPVLQVVKNRSLYEITRHAHRIAVSLDQVNDLGAFVELEILANEPDLDRAKAVLSELAREWRLEQTERRSYLEMVLERRAG